MRGEKRAMAPRPQVVAVGKTARKDHAVRALEVAVLVPEHEGRPLITVAPGVKSVGIAIGPGELTTTELHGRDLSDLEPVEFSMIGLARTRWAISGTGLGLWPGHSPGRARRPCPGGRP